ncbi:MAG TPA: LPS biosynthesis glycosyltransferase [Microcoleaceae bacterium UBA10368]|jgi:Glycosyltransferase involved in LPS biosynthesis|nr:LPS biosynthesis glycosyltransferase [Microcoleaceae cyanobacterium UBA10368]HCV31439.1 LPS biosynthesis glycosyltransferase [Microcoleaceae cyanobacterium UBA9251]
MTKITDYFQGVYAVNLPERKDRRKLIVKELEAAGMPLTPHKVEIFPAIRPDEAGCFPSIGARGCFSSHVAILKQAKKLGLSNVLIVEDDLAISPDFVTEQAAIVEQLRQQDWDFVYFGHVEEVGGKSPVALVPFSEGVMTTHFYAVNDKIFDRLLRFLEELQQRPPGHPDGGPMHLDGAYSTFRSQNPDVVTLIASPNLGWQKSSRSDIYPNSWFDRVPGIRELVGVLRASKTWLKRLVSS